MKPFAFFFRQSPVSLTDEQQQRRTEEVRVWAIRQQQEGCKLEPKILTADSRRIARNAQPAADPPLIAALFLQARDWDEAMRIAQTHPGINYGVEIEVRGWVLPSPGPAAASNPGT